MQPVSLHMLGSGFLLLQHPKKNATTFAMSSAVPWVHPTSTVVASIWVGLGGRLMSLDPLVNGVQLLRSVMTIVITSTGS